jgi:transcriptional regulator
MSFFNAYLTPKQKNLWRLRFDGHSQSEISRKTGVTRQTINKAFGVIDTKVTKALLEGAKFNKIEISSLNMERGYLLGHSMEFGLEALMTFSDENGLQIWYKGEGNCSKCENIESCRKNLVKEAEIRGIQIPLNPENEVPSRIADILFEEIMK